MNIIAKILTSIVAAIHLYIMVFYIMVFEMFLLESRGPKVFTDFPLELFEPTKVIAANQGLYNGFLAADLLWALLFIKDQKWKKNVATFFLLCVAIAGVYGAATATKNILFVQTLPAVLADQGSKGRNPLDIKTSNLGVERTPIIMFVNRLP